MCSEYNYSVVGAAGRVRDGSRNRYKLVTGMRKPPTVVCRTLGLVLDGRSGAASHVSARLCPREKKFGPTMLGTNEFHRKTRKDILSVNSAGQCPLGNGARRKLTLLFVQV